MKRNTIEQPTNLQNGHHRANCKLENVLGNLPTAGYRDGKQTYKVDDARRRRLLKAREAVTSAIERNERAGELMEVYHGESKALLDRADEILEATKPQLHVVD